MIEVVSVGKPWKATETSDPLWTIVIKSEGEPQKTYDEKLAQVGQHDAESYVAKTSGKTYWRTKSQNAGGYKATPKSFKADPEKMRQEFTLEVARNQSIQRQVALKCAVELIVSDDGMTVEAVDEMFNHFMKLLANPWREEIENVVEDAGDFHKINPTDFEQPPVENYDE